MTIKEIKFKDAVINIDDIIITYTHPFFLVKNVQVA